jgi:uncharacterized phage-associated protein
MAFEAFDVAKWFINRVDRESGESITHLKVQKLLYFAEAWYQVLHGKDLFNEQIEAWAHGPVVREVYGKLSDYGWQALPPIDPTMLEFPEDVQGALELVVDLYDRFGAKQLESITHTDRPWLDARGGLAPEARCTAPIDKSAIRAYFKEKYREALIEDQQGEG